VKLWVTQDGRARQQVILCARQEYRKRSEEGYGTFSPPSTQLWCISPEKFPNVRFINVDKFTSGKTNRKGRQDSPHPAKSDVCRSDPIDAM